MPLAGNIYKIHFKLKLESKWYKIQSEPSKCLQSGGDNETFSTQLYFIKTNIAFDNPRYRKIIIKKCKSKLAHVSDKEKIQIISDYLILPTHKK